MTSTTVLWVIAYLLALKVAIDVIGLLFSFRSIKKIWRKVNMSEEYLYQINERVDNIHYHTEKLSRTKKQRKKQRKKLRKLTKKIDRI